MVWNILDFQKDQDLRLKVGYEIVDKVCFTDVTVVHSRLDGLGCLVNGLKRIWVKMVYF